MDQNITHPVGKKIGQKFGILGGTFSTKRFSKAYPKQYLNYIRAVSI